MSERAPQRRSPRSTAPERSPGVSESAERGDNDPGELLSLLGDEHTREVLSVLGSDAMPARAVVERSAVSKPTVYRRLDRLEAAGVVETRMSVESDGNHRQEFRVAADGLALTVGGESLAVDVLRDTAADRHPASEPAEHS